MLGRLLKYLLHAILIRPLLQLYLGLNVKYSPHWETYWPPKGPAIIIANHNSHLDTLVIESLFPYGLLYRIRSIAAADYWLKNKCLAWFAVSVMRIIPVKRCSGRDGSDPFADVHDVLHCGGIVIIYPEGERGQPEQQGTIKKGITYLMQQHPDVPVIPMHLYGAGKAQCRVSKWWQHIPLPFIIDVVVDEPIRSRAEFSDLKSPEASSARSELHALVVERFASLSARNSRGAWV